MGYTHCLLRSTDKHQNTTAWQILIKKCDELAFVGHFTDPIYYVFEIYINSRQQQPRRRPLKKLHTNIVYFSIIIALNRLGHSTQNNPRNKEHHSQLINTHSHTTTATQVLLGTICLCNTLFHALCQSRLFSPIRLREEREPTSKLSFVAFGRFGHLKKCLENPLKIRKK